MPFSRASQKRLLGLLIRRCPIYLILLDLSEVCEKNSVNAKSAGDWAGYQFWDWQALHCGTASDSLREIEARHTRNSGATSAPHQG